MPCLPRIAGTIRSKNRLKGAVEILSERLYYAALKQPPPSHNILASTPKRDPKWPKKKRQIHFFNIDQELVYLNFLLDFGPLNLAQLTRFCHKLNDKLRKFPVVCFYSSTQPAKRANAQFLICAWQVLYLKRSPRQAYQGFQVNDSFQQSTSSLFSMNPETDGDNQHPSPQQQQQEQQQSGTQQLLHSLPPISQSQGAPTVAAIPPFRDASLDFCTYGLSVLDCLDGLVKAVQFGFWNIDDFDLEEYEHFEQVQNGDLNWLVKGRILAFAGPSFQRHVSLKGRRTLSPADYTPYFKQQNVHLVVRLNEKNYHERDFEEAGIRHVEHFFVDGSCPSMKVLDAVLTDFEAVPEDRAFAVHCKAGLGRTGTCIGAYLMKHYRFTAAEVIGWMRICRPGCVIGSQQQFLQTIQARMWQAGESINIPRNQFFLKATNQTQQDQQDQQQSRLSEPESPRHLLSKDAVDGRSGQGESLLAARLGRQNHPNSTLSNNSKMMATTTTALATPPITPEPKEKGPVIVTPDSDARFRHHHGPGPPTAGGGSGGGSSNSNNRNSNNKSGGSSLTACDDAIASSGVCGDSHV